MTVSFDTYTLLPLDSYAKTLSINPVHFSQASGAEFFPGASGSNCFNIFFQNSWQLHDVISREEIALAVKEAEQDIVEVLGYSPAYNWVAGENHQYPLFYRPDYFQSGGRDNRGQWKTVKANQGKIVEPGVQAFLEVESAIPTVFIPGASGFAFQTVTITVPIPPFPIEQLKIFPPFVTDPTQEQSLEIRPFKKIEITDTEVIFTFDGWQLIDPEQVNNPPTTGSPNDLSLNIEDASIYLDDVNVWREFADPTQAQAILYWDRNLGSVAGVPGCNSCTSCGGGGSGCGACQTISQPACLSPLDLEQGTLSPIPAVFDETSQTFVQSGFFEGREPDRVKIWYRAGEAEKVPNYFAHAATWMATARLGRDLCTCGTVQAYASELQQDISVSSGDVSRFNAESTLENPFGTRKGEVMAWSRIGKLISANIGVGSV